MWQDIENLSVSICIKTSTMVVKTVDMVFCIFYYDSFVCTELFWTSLHVYVCRSRSSPQELCDSEGVGRRDWRSGERVAEVCKVTREEPSVSSEEIVVVGPLPEDPTDGTDSEPKVSDWLLEAMWNIIIIYYATWAAHTHTTAYNHIHQYTQNYILRSTLCPKKVSPLNILQQPPQTCTDLNEILHTQDDIYFCHWRQIS